MCMEVVADTQVNKSTGTAAARVAVVVGCGRRRLFTG